LWHKIFGAPAEPVARVVETQEEVAEISESEVSYEAHDEFARSEVRSLSGDEVIASEFVDEAVEGATSTDDEREQSEQRRGRSRRRRRGGRGRKSGGRSREGRAAEPQVHEQGGDDQLGPEFDDLTDDEDDFPQDDSLDTSSSLNGESDVEDSDDERSPAHSRALSASQRAIPSWDDAIGFIVESNMQNRSQRPSRPRSDSRGGPSRGRSRGRRK
jgi:ribonuclease E